MTKNFFIIGVRRSGTSILRTLLMKHPGIKGIEFEPHPLWFATMMQHFDRFNGAKFYKEIITTFRKRGKDRYFGAKFAVNPGIDVLDWIWLDEVFNRPQIIFIKRNLMDSYHSYKSVDINIRRGAIDENSYYPAFAFVQKTFENFNMANPGRSCILQYEQLVENPEAEMRKATETLRIAPMIDIKKHIKKPKNWGGR